MNEEILGSSSSTIEDILKPVAAPSPVITYPADLATPLFADDFNRSSEILTANIKWGTYASQASYITNRELKTSDNSGSVYLAPNNPVVFPDVTKTYLESSVRVDGSGGAQYLILPYADSTNMIFQGCFFSYSATDLKIYAGDYMAFAGSTLAPLATLTNYPAGVANYLGCEVNQASGTVTAFLNSAQIGKVENLTIPGPANSSPLVVGFGLDMVVDNFKAFPSFASARLPNDGELRIYNTPYAGYYLDQLANFSLQGYCANNGATVQIKDAASGTFQSSIATCINNSFTVNTDLSSGIRFPRGANQIRIEYVNAGNTKEYFYNFSNFGNKLSPPTLVGPTPTSGNKNTEFAWTVNYPAGSIVNLTPAFVDIFGDNAGCVTSVSSVSATAYTVKLKGCTKDAGGVGIQILAGSAKDTLGGDYPASAISGGAQIVNTPPVMSVVTYWSTGNENTTFRWEINYAYATAVTLTASHVQVLGENDGCSVNVVYSSADQRYVDVTGCSGNGNIGLKILAGSASNGNGVTAEKSTALDVAVVNPIVIGFSQQTSSVIEGNNSNAKQMYISLDRPSKVNLEISYSVVTEFTTAVNPTHYNLASSGTVTIPAGQTTWPINYNYYGDVLALGTKQIQVALDGVLPRIPNVYIGKNQVHQQVVVDEESVDNFREIIAGGSNSTCGLTVSGVAKCWGYNGYGHLGDGTSVDKPIPTLVSGANTYAMLSANLYSTCGLTVGGVLKCWGSNNYGQLGDGTIISKNTPTTVSGTDTYMMVSVGSYHSCGIVSGGVAKCWGLNNYGQLGNGTLTTRTTPIVVSGTQTFTMLAAGYEHTCGITSTGIVKCWGRNNDGQLGNGTAVNSSVPVPISGGDTYTMISGRGYHTCGITTVGVVKCWGQNYSGKLGNGTTTMSSIPVAINDSDTYVWISAGYLSTCGITTTGRAKCWGENEWGQLGDHTSVDKYSPVFIDDSDTYVNISVGHSTHTCGVTTNGVAKCWGIGSNGQLGFSNPTSKSVPTIISSSSPRFSLSVGSTHACGIAAGGSVKCWGIDLYRARLEPFFYGYYRAVPTEIGDIETYSAISAGSYHTCGITTAGVAKCWGRNENGQLGDGFLANNSAAVIVSDSETYAKISTGLNYTCGVTTAGVAKCWGLNNNGQLGDGSTMQRRLPTAVSDTATYSQVSTGSDFSCGVTTGGVGKCWGKNANGLGDGSTTNSAVPVIVSGGDTYTAISTGYWHACGITLSGTVKCWGENNFGQLGNGTGAASSFPVAINDGSTYVKISAGSTWTCGITSAGVAKCWGQNNFGQLGDSSIVTRLSPVAVSDAATYSQISVGKTSYTCGVTTTNLVKCWGENNNGTLGLGEILDVGDRPFRVVQP